MVMPSPIENVLRELVNDTRGYYPEEGDTHIPNALSQIRGLMPEKDDGFKSDDYKLVYKAIGFNSAIDEVLKLLGEWEK